MVMAAMLEGKTVKALGLRLIQIGIHIILLVDWNLDGIQPY